MSPCYVRHHLRLNRRLQPAVRQGQFLHSSQTSAGHRRRKIGRYSFAIVGSSQLSTATKRDRPMNRMVSAIVSLAQHLHAIPFTPPIGRAHVCTPFTNAHLVCPLLHEKNKSTTLIHTSVSNKKQISS